MGMYTLLHLNFNLKMNTPSEVIRVLKVMTSHESEIPDSLPNHPFFNCSRWRHMLLCGSAYFDEKPESSIFPENGVSRVLVTCNFKNYDNEIDLFMDWLNPYIDVPIGAKVGFSRYEEDDENTMILKK